jgi:GNAT superfamily N-acetyltransferase
MGLLGERRARHYRPVGTDEVFVWRAITVEDCVEWARLLNAIEESYGTEEFVGAEDLADDLSDPDVDPRRGTIAAFSRGSMVAWAGLRASAGADDRHEMRLLGGVHPGQRGRGLGTRLLAWTDQAALALHRACRCGGQLALSASCPADQQDALALFAGAGYKQMRWFHFMSRDLGTEVPYRPAPDDTQISGYAAELSEVARQVLNRAFGDQRGSTEWTAESWQRWVVSPAFRPAFSFLAHLGGQPAGVLMALEYDAFAQATGRRECYIATVGVTGPARGRGIASALIGRSLAAARADGCNVATLRVDAESPAGTLSLYERIGFTRQYTSATVTKDLTDH